MLPLAALEVTLGVQLKPEGEGQGGKGQEEGMGSGLLEGGADRATLERLRWAIVVDHAALGLALGREEQAAESGHLQKEEVTLVTPAGLL